MRRKKSPSRIKLREWRKQQDSSKFYTRYDPKTGREMRFKRAPNRFFALLTGGDQDSPEISQTHFDNLYQGIPKGMAPSEWISIRMVHFLSRNQPPDRCWFSGVLVYLVPWALAENLHWKTPWRASFEHLVPTRNGGNRTEGNLVAAGQALNMTLGHIPLPVKILVRQHLQTCTNYDRDLPTFQTYLKVLQEVIFAQNQVMLEGKYPWQNWCYEPGTKNRKMADTIASEMLDLEANFLKQDTKGRKQWLDDFRWRW